MFFMPGTRMLFGDAKASCDGMYQSRLSYLTVNTSLLISLSF